MKETDYTKGAHIILRQLCVPASLSGYRYLVCAISIVAADPSRLNLVTKDLYIEIGKNFGRSWSCVERSMRSAISAAYDNGGEEAMSRILAHHAERPSPTLFIAAGAEATAKLCTPIYDQHPNLKQLKWLVEQCTQ